MDGAKFEAFAARADRPTGAGVVVLPDVRGLHRFYRDLAVGFAEAGFDAVSIDYFGRTAGVGDRSEGFQYRSHVDQTTPEGIAADVQSAVEYLKSDPGGGVDSVITVGFCFGGGHSWRLAGDLPGLAGVVGFYGRPALAERSATRTLVPMLMLAAGADKNIPVGDVEDLAQRVNAAGGNAEVVVYPDAPHSFFDRTQEAHAEACADAWTRVVDFIATVR